MSTTAPQPARAVPPASHPGPVYVVAYLAGHGIGPEVTAAASRALAELSRTHGFGIDEVHPAFDTEAVARSGHPLPMPTRQATRNADAVLVAGADAPALVGVRAGLDLSVAVTRMLEPAGESTLFAPLHDGAQHLTVQRAFTAACESSGRLTSVGVSTAWTALVDRHAIDNPGVHVTHLSLATGLRAITQGGCGVMVAETAIADALAEAPRLAGRTPLVATGELSADGPGLFAPSHGTAHDAAGHGAADPSEMLLATALLLTEGLGRRAAGEALEASLSVALGQPLGAPGAAGPGVTATTREFVDAVLALLPSARRDTEFALEVVR